jgi:hypothetical protein
MTDEARYFYCYSAKLRRFIRENGIRWIETNINENTDRPYWKFEQTNARGRIIEEYKRLR